MAEQQAIEPAELSADDLNDRLEDTNPERALELAKKTLDEADRNVSIARRDLEVACERRSRAAQKHGKLRQAGRNLPLHILNAAQSKITRVEDNRRFKALDAIADLQGHVRPGKRDHPRTESRAALENQE